LEAEREANAGATGGARVSGHVADISIEESWLAFRDAALKAHGSPDHIDMLFCNAGIAGGWSMFTTSREQWEKTFAVNWNGVYFEARTFLPLLKKSKEAQIVNTASVNALHASLGPELPHTSYSAAKFAVRGFTEALITDCRINEPHIKVALVMPGYVGTGIVANTAKQYPENRVSRERMEAFRNEAPVSADQAAGVILEGVKKGKW
jgi:NAD(P)-dependent dehydrogenase (short-subunit alcohol dehydrogenase family)